MGKFLLAAVALTLLVYAFFDLLSTPRGSVLRLPKAAWFLIIVLPFVGPLAWLALGRTRRPPQPPQPPRPGPMGPEDDWRWGK